MQIQVLSGWTAAANDLGKLPLADTTAGLREGASPAAHSKSVMSIFSQPR